MRIGSNVEGVLVLGTEGRVFAALARVWAGCASAAKKRNSLIPKGTWRYFGCTEGKPCRYVPNPHNWRQRERKWQRRLKLAGRRFRRKKTSPSRYTYPMRIESSLWDTSLPSPAYKMSTFSTT